MPPKTKKSAEQLKRAAGDLDDALNESPVKKKKSRTKLVEPTVALPDPVPPPAEPTNPEPEFIEKYEPESALRLTKAQYNIDYAVGKINFYADFLNVFDNKLDDKAVAIANRASGKIEKWGSHQERLQKSMDVLLKVAPKKKAGMMMSTKTAEGFLSSSGKPRCHRCVGSRRLSSSSEFFLNFHLFLVLCAYASFFFRILSDSLPWLVATLSGLSALPLRLICLLSVYLPPCRLICPPRRPVCLLARLICHPVGLSATWAYLPPSRSSCWTNQLAPPARCSLASTYG
jgi:hypothetical protein